MLVTLLNEFRLAPIIIQLASIAIVVSLIITLFSYILILKQRFNGYTEEKRRIKLEPIIDEAVISKIITNEMLIKANQINNIPLDIQSLRGKPFLKKRNRQILINHLMHYRKSVGGINGEMLKEIYLELGLDKDSMQKLRSPRWNAKVLGLQEMTTMELNIPDVNILPLTNHKNRNLRSAARSAYLKLSKNEAFKFFDLVTEPMLKWDQIELFRIITSLEGLTIPNFANWIAYSTNKTMVDFCIKLAVHYNQVNAGDAIIELLDSKDHALRASAINAIGKLRLEEAEDKMIRIYNSQPVSCQTEILKAIGRIESGKSYSFLKAEFMQANDFNIRKNAARSLVNSRGLPKGLIDELKETASPENLRILKHCMNPLIHF